MSSELSRAIAKRPHMPKISFLYLAVSSINSLQRYVYIYTGPVGPVGPGPDQKLSSNIYVDNDFSVSSACCLHWSSANTCVYVCIICIEYFLSESGNTAKKKKKLALGPTK